MQKFIIFCLAVSFWCIFSTKAASYVSTCTSCKNETVDNLNKCVLKDIEAVLTHLGKEQYEGLQSIDPMKTRDIDIYITEGIVRLNQSFQNVTIYGMSDTNVTSLNITGVKQTINETEVLKWTMKMVTQTKLFRLNGIYRLMGNLSAMPINGTGDCNITLGDLEVNHTIIGRLTDKLRAETDSYKVTFNPKTVAFNFENLFTDPTIQNSVKALSYLIFQEVKPGYETVFGNIFKDYTNSVFKHIENNGSLCKIFEQKA